MKVTIEPIVIGAFVTITKRLLKSLEDLEVGGSVETIQMTALQRTARILRRDLEIEETCSHSNSSEKPSANIDVKNCKGVNNKKKKKQNSKILWIHPEQFNSCSLFLIELGLFKKNEIILNVWIFTINKDQTGTWNLV